MKPMKPWQRLLLLLPLIQAWGAEGDSFSTPAKLDLAMPTNAPDLKLGVKITRWNPIPPRVIWAPFLVPRQIGGPIMADTVDPLGIQKEGQGQGVNGVWPPEIVPVKIVGVGVALWIHHVTGRPQIVGVVPDSAASAAGLSWGDTIYMIEEANTEGWIWRPLFA